MAIRKAWFVEEIEGADGQIAQRMTIMEFDNTDGAWVRPDDRLSVGERATWDLVMSRVSNVQGQDLRHMVHPVTLMDFCHGHPDLRRK